MTERIFEGKAALVTGASRGIGLAVAAALLARGARVAITGRKPDSLAEAARELDGGEAVRTIVANAGDPDAARAAVDETVEAFGSLDLLVNNAGTNPVFGDLIDVDVPAVTKILQVNTVGPLVYTQQAWRAWMREHGGAIVNMASSAGVRTSPGIAAYGMSKAALINMTAQFAVELGPRVRINAVAPAVVKTRFARMLYEHDEQGVAAKYPLKRLGEVEDVADAVCFLLSEAASWITGETLNLDGGGLKVLGA